MAEKSYTARVMVLKKTKLKETDLIVTCLRENGQALRAVAKGARKPSSSFSSRLEPASIVDVLVARGRGDLGIIQEARLVASHEAARNDLDRITALTPCLELLARACQPDISVPRLFSLTEAFVCSMENVDAQQALALAAAHLMKASAFLGYRPSFDMCVVCGSPLALYDDSTMRYLSITEGGSVCSHCQGSVHDGTLVSSSLVSWMQFVLMSPLEQIKRNPPDISVSRAIVEYMQAWIKIHGGIHIKALDFLLASGLY